MVATSLVATQQTDSFAMSFYRPIQFFLKTTRVLSISIALLGFSHPILAEDIPKLVTQAIANLVPDLEPDSIVSTPIPNLYLVALGAQVAYVSADGQYLLTGDMIEIESGRNLSEGVRNNFRKVLMTDLDDEDMVIFSPTSVRSTITVFTDISCPYCVRFHQEVKDLMDAGIRVRYAGYPRAGIPSTAYDALVSIWCSDVPQQAMNEAKSGLDIADRTCDTAIAKHMEVAQNIGVRGTPTIILESGKMIPGYIPADQLLLEVTMESD